MSVRLTFGNHETTHLLLEVFFLALYLGSGFTKTRREYPSFVKIGKMTSTLHKCLHTFWVSLVTSITMVPL